MSSYQDYQTQIAELQAKAEAVRRTELAEAKAKIQTIMSEYGLTVADIVGGSKRAPKVGPRPKKSTMRARQLAIPGQVVDAHQSGLKIKKKTNT